MVYERWIAGLIETGIVLIAAALIRILVVPKSTFVPHGVQLLLEEGVRLADGLLAGIAGAGKGLVRGVGGFFRALRTAGVRGRQGLRALWRQDRRVLTIWGCTVGVFLILSLLTVRPGEHEDVQTAMRDAVLHDVNRVSLFGLKDVDPALIAAMTVTGVLLALALVLRLFAVPRFRTVPRGLQLALETLVRTLDGLAKADDPMRCTFIGAYVFTAGVYIFTGTLFELFGLQAVTTTGRSIALPAPLSDVNAAICMGCLSYLVIVCGGIRRRGVKGLLAALKEFSLPISMSFRLFGALLSGLLVTELVYHYIALSFVLPVVVGVLFTLLHALVQSYVLTMLVGIYFAEVTETEGEEEREEAKEKEAA